jgi:hypothetical protein
MAGSKSLLIEILSNKLPAIERNKFIEWSNSVTNEEFDNDLTLFFKINEVQDAVGEYAIEQLQELETHCNIKISATVDVNGSIYKYRQ